MSGRYVGETAVGISAAVRAGRVTPAEVLEEHLERIEALDGRLGAFPMVRTEEVRAEARALEGRGDLGGLPLAGVPVAVRDSIDVAGSPTRSGSAATSPAPAAADAELVRRLRAAGALLVGKTSLPELGLWPFTESEAFGVTRNPWSLDHNAGGSSGGSAAAVASAMVPIALAVDGGGSIRIPASNCGLVGIKPGLGVVPFPAGGTSALFGMNEFGPLATTVADLGLMLDVLAGTDTYRAVAPPDRPLRVGVTAKPGALGVKVDREVRTALDRTAEALRDAGHQVVIADPPWRNGDAGPFLHRFFARHRRGGRAAGPGGPGAPDPGRGPRRPPAAPDTAGRRTAPRRGSSPATGLVRGPRRAAQPDPGRSRRYGSGPTRARAGAGPCSA